MTFEKKKSLSFKVSIIKESKKEFFKPGADEKQRVNVCQKEKKNKEVLLYL